MFSFCSLLYCLLFKHLLIFCYIKFHTYFVVYILCIYCLMSLAQVVLCNVPVRIHPSMDECWINEMYVYMYADADMTCSSVARAVIATLIVVYCAVK
jgi:hypothetical protein